MMIGKKAVVAFAAAFAASGFFVSASDVSAAAVDCSATIYATAVDDMSGPGGTNDGCNVGSVNNDNPLPGQVNADMMFGFDDWEYGGKWDGPSTFLNGDVDISFTINGDGMSGDWSVISTLFDDYTELMIVQKGSAADNTEPQDYVGYLFTKDGTGATSGGYVSAFLNTNSDNPKDISHWTAYVRGACDPLVEICDPPVNEVPVPAGLPLMLTALGAVGILARRKKLQ